MLLEHPGSSCQNTGNFSRYNSGQGKKTACLFFTTDANYAKCLEKYSYQIQFNWAPWVREFVTILSGTAGLKINLSDL